VRRLVAVIPTTLFALTLLASPALAEGHGGASGAHGGDHQASAKPHGGHGEGQKSKHHKPKVHHVTLVGVISDTPTATIGSGSDTATSTITINVRGGDRAEHGMRSLVITLDKDTVVRRNGPAKASDLKLGDHVSVKARRLADGSWLATRVNASAPEPAKPEGDH
jgi:hypothetical protein